MRPPTPLPSRPISIPSSSQPSEPLPSASSSSTSPSSSLQADHSFSSTPYSLPHSLLSRSYLSSTSPLSSPPRPTAAYFPPTSSPLAPSPSPSPAAGLARSVPSRPSPFSHLSHGHSSTPSPGSTSTSAKSSPDRRRSTSSPLVGSWSSSLLSMRTSSSPQHVSPPFSARLRLPPAPSLPHPHPHSSSSPASPPAARILTQPFTPSFYSLESPYVTLLHLPAPQLLPQKGTLQLLLLNPEEQPLRVFLVPFDTRAWGAGERGYLRQMCYAPLVGTGGGNPAGASGDAVEAAVTVEREREKGKGVLKYAVQFCLACTSAAAPEPDLDKGEQEQEQDEQQPGRGGPQGLFEMDDVPSSPRLSSRSPPSPDSNEESPFTHRRRRSSTSASRRPRAKPKPLLPPQHAQKQVWLQPTIRVVFASRTVDEDGPLRVETEVESSSGFLLPTQAGGGSVPSSPLSPTTPTGGKVRNGEGLLSRTAPRRSDPTAGRLAVSPPSGGSGSALRETGASHPPDRCGTLSPSAPVNSLPPTTQPRRERERKRSTSPFPLPLSPRLGPTLGLSTQSMQGVVSPPSSRSATPTLGKLGPGGLGAVGGGERERERERTPRLKGLGLPVPDLSLNTDGDGARAKSPLPGARRTALSAALDTEEEDSRVSALADRVGQLGVLTLSDRRRQREREDLEEGLVRGWDGRVSRVYGESCAGGLGNSGRWADEAVIR